MARLPTRQATPPWRIPGSGSKLRIWLVENGLSLGLIIAILVVWQAVQSRGVINKYILPTPVMIGQELVSNWDLLLRNAVPTLLEAATGFLIGNAVGVLIAVLFVYSPVVEDAFYPLAIVLRSLPMVAVTPILVVWLGPGFASKVALTALITFFPTLVNMVQGLSSAETSALELMHTLAARERQVFLKIRLPFALPHLFTAMRIAGSAAVLGAMVAEWIGSARGLGYLILQAMFNFQGPLVWATMLVASLLSMAAYFLVVLVERLVIPWHAAQEQTGGDL
jgi:NitT/TauT family transport system permease protein